MIALVLGVAEAVQGAVSPDLASMIGPVNIMAGGALLVAVWVGRGFLRIGEKFFDQQATKVLALPSAEELSADRRTLFERLEAFAQEGRTGRGEIMSRLDSMQHKLDEERLETLLIRQNGLRTLDEHEKRIGKLERSS